MEPFFVRKCYPLLPIAAPIAVHGLSMDESMDRPWTVHALSMDSPWTVHGQSMDCPLTVHQLSMDYQWNVHAQSNGLSMDDIGFANPQTLLVDLQCHMTVFVASLCNIDSHCGTYG